MPRPSSRGARTGAANSPRPQGQGRGSWEGSEEAAHGRSSEGAPSPRTMHRGLRQVGGGGNEALHEVQGRGQDGGMRILSLTSGFSSRFSVTMQRLVQSCVKYQLGSLTVTVLCTQLYILVFPRPLAPTLLLWGQQYQPSIRAKAAITV